MLHAERVPVGLVLGLALAAGAFAIPARSAPPLPPVITIAEPQVIAVDSIVQRVESCPQAIVEHIKPAGHATCVHGQFRQSGYFVHIAYFTTEWWEHIGVVDEAGKTIVSFVDRPSLSGDAEIRLRAADLDSDGVDEVIGTYGFTRAVEVFSVKAEVMTLARADAVRD